ncbi:MULTISPECIES: hypothetical protein [Natrinema]|uniref:Uncharacterized protein n=2 Tax=Natrinema TaxID=88723 RepID=A0A2A5QZU4_9EURY|nr:MULTISPECIES: hypothetical protein [Natrinema]MBZ6495423.1 hypothetical protein [Natrinema longum]PCR92341.1 hypothetical protein CP557_18500 [Natrinema ejinorense]QSW86605.1 hypothetical protein J0X27_07260 [Natrinema longum]
MSESTPGGNAADAFASRARTEHGESIRELVVFGDAVRGDDRGVHASMEVLLVLEEDDEEIERRLEALAETVGLEHGVVFSVHVLPADRFESQSDHPFIRTALEEGHSYV